MSGPFPCGGPANPVPLIKFADPCRFLNEEEFNRAWPEFQGKNMLTIVSFHLEMAEVPMDPRVWRKKTALGHGLQTAHLLCNSPMGKTAKMVPDNGQTTYGKLYDKLARIVGSTYRVTI